VTKSKGRGRQGFKDGCKPPRRCGFKVGVAFDKNELKSNETMKKYRTGYKFAWGIPRVRQYMSQIGLKAPGTYSKNQHNGVMFALPSEVQMSGNQAGTIARLCYKAGGTHSQLENVRKMLSYAHQLTTGSKKGNFREVYEQWESQNPDGYLRPTQKIKAEVSPDCESVEKMMTTPFDEAKGMPYPRWNVGLLLVFDSLCSGARSVTDLHRIKMAPDHVFAPSQGWMSTSMKGGRAKLERRKGTRRWCVYRPCLCPEGKHVPPPEDWHQHVDMMSNPKNITWCTNCPLNAFQCIRDLLPEEDIRSYPAWLEAQQRYRKDNLGEESMKKLVAAWIDLQGGNPDGLKYDTNGGRKTLGKLCQKYGVLYHESFELHGDLWCTWAKYYQEKLARDPLFKRRTQSKNPDVCLVALRKFARGFRSGVAATPSVKQQLENLRSQINAILGHLN